MKTDENSKKAQQTTDQRAVFAMGESRKQLFEPYLDEAAVEAGLKNGSLVRGTLRVSSSKTSVAWIKLENAKEEKDWVP